MNTYDKINILNQRIDLFQYSLVEHNRILDEELDLLQPGDEDTIRYMITEIQRIINALENARQVLTTA